MEKSELVEGERKFLHDISTPLSILNYQLEQVLKRVSDPESKARLEQCQNQVNKVIEQLEKRRTLIKQQL